MKSTLVSLHVILLLVTTHAISNSGKEFVIGFMENFAKKGTLELFFTTTYRSAVVNVSAPLYPPAKLQVCLNITYGQVKSITVDTELMSIGEARTYKAVYVTSDNPISVYGLNQAPYSTDGFLQFPTDALGTIYRVMCHKHRNETRSEFLIVGVHNLTLVEITLSRHLGTYTASFEGKEYRNGTTFQIHLNRFEVAQINSPGDLTGTYVFAEKEIGLYSGNDIAYVGPGADDYLVQMIPSVEKWGKAFVTVPLPHRTVGDNFCIMSSEGDTIVQLSGECDGTISLKRAGDVQEIHINSSSRCYIEANKAVLVLVVQFSRGGNDLDPGDPAMIVVQPVEHFISWLAFAVPKGAAVDYENFLMIVVESKHKAGLKLDGMPISNYFLDIKMTNFSSAAVQISDGHHILTHDLPNVGFASYLYGRGSYESYAFPVGMRLAPINSPCSSTTMVPGDDVDNDCDGKIDEELCENFEDDDEDGRVDEDCATEHFSNGLTVVKTTASLDSIEEIVWNVSLPVPVTPLPLLAVDRWHWLPLAEAIILSLCLVIILGAILCCCHRCYRLLCLQKKKKEKRSDRSVVVVPRCRQVSLSTKPPTRNRARALEFI